ncbi:MAG: YgjV family protein [Acholeplasmataceae bacterium]|nr:YgjV family protein [Acholeplasmataceae bacterium]
MPNLVEWIGYIASLIVLISLVMSSVKKLRWINMVGSVIFAVYGVLIASYPVAVMNLGIVIVNVYYLVQLYGKKDLFKLIPIADDAYLNHFMDVYNKDISQFIDLSYDLSDETLTRFFVSRNTVPAGLFIGKKADKDMFEIIVDYSTPAYRDFKMAEFLFKNQKEVFLKQGYKTLLSKPGHEKHSAYLEKIGFKPITYQNQAYYSIEI